MTLLHHHVRHYYDHIIDLDHSQFQDCYFGRIKHGAVHCVYDQLSYFEVMCHVGQFPQRNVLYQSSCAALVECCVFTL